MSAWIVPKEHIDVMVKSILVHLGEGDRLGKFDQDHLDGIGQMFWRECWNSIGYRYSHYPDGQRPGPIGFTYDEIGTYRYNDPGFEPTPGEAAMTFACYEYQSCEHPEYTESEASKQVARMLRKLDVGARTEGPWGWDVDQIQERQQR